MITPPLFVFTGFVFTDALLNPCMDGREHKYRRTPHQS
jgi:hypothetical protein